MCKNKKQIVATGKFLQLVNENGWEYAERPNATGVVVILAITDDNRIILTEQFRVPIGKRVIDLPAGLVGDVPGQEDEDNATAAKRELLEETGYECAQMNYLAHGPSSAGLTSEQVTFFRATGLKKVHDGGGDDTEDIQVHAIPLDDLDSWIAARDTQQTEIDLKLYSGLYFAGHQFSS